MDAFIACFLFAIGFLIYKAIIAQLGITAEAALLKARNIPQRR